MWPVNTIGNSGNSTHIVQTPEKYSRKSMSANFLKVVEQLLPRSRDLSELQYGRCKEILWGWLLSNSQKSKINPEFLHRPVRNNSSYIGIINAISNHFSSSRTWVSEAVCWPVKLGMSSLEKLSSAAREKPPVPHTQKTEENREQLRNTPQGNFCLLHACTQTANPKQADT